MNMAQPHGPESWMNRIADVMQPDVIVRQTHGQTYGQQQLEATGEKPSTCGVASCRVLQRKCKILASFVVYT